jgi:hypothetical protein
VPLDDATFDRLLEAAFVIQEQNDRAAAQPRVDFTRVLDEIVSLQRAVQTQHLSLEQALPFIAEKAQRIVPSDGVAIALLETGELYYRAGTGTAAGQVGERRPLTECLSMAAVQTGDTLLCRDSLADAKVHTAPGTGSGVRSFIAVPVHHERKVAGVLEFRFAGANAFQDHDVRACQLIGGIVSEAVARASEREWKQVLAVERATMIEALERIQPQLDRLMAGKAELQQPSKEAAGRAGSLINDVPPAVPAMSTLAAESEAPSSSSKAPSMAETTEPETLLAPAKEEHVPAVTSGESASPPGTPRSKPPKQAKTRARRKKVAAIPGTPAPTETEEKVQTDLQKVAQEAPLTPAAGLELSECRNCGHEIREDEIFCGICGTPRKPGEPGGGSIQSKWASLWHIQQAAEMKRLGSEEVETAAPVPPVEERTESTPASPDEQKPPVQESATASGPDAGGKDPWSSASGAMRWLQSMAGAKKGAHLQRFWRAQRANVYLATSTLLLIAVIFGKTPQNRIARDAGSRAKPHLSFGEKLMIDLGLAEPPPAPEYKGNPAVQVWVDTRSALYYCPEAELYGKTEQGKFTTQKDAQLDQYEPASRKVCE